MFERYKRRSWEFFNGTEFYEKQVKFPISGYFKLIHDEDKNMLYVFHEAGKDAVPLFRHSTVDYKSFGKVDFQTFRKLYKSEAEKSFKWKWSATSLSFAASRICTLREDGLFECDKSRLGNPLTENVKEILDVSKSILEYSIKTGLEPAKLDAYEVMHGHI